MATATKYELRINGVAITFASEQDLRKAQACIELAGEACFDWPRESVAGYLATAKGLRHSKQPTIGAELAPTEQTPTGGEP